MARFRISRRTVLRGLAGVGVAIPVLEIMSARSARAQAVTIPKRFLLSYGGLSLAGSGGVDNFVPVNTGAGYDIKRGLKPLLDMGIRDQVSIVSGLTIPWDTGSGAPPGGRAAQFHFHTVAPQIAGTKTYPLGNTSPSKPTADQIVADVIAGSTRFRVLPYRVQPALYLGSNSVSGNEGRLSWEMRSGSLAAVEPFSNPRLAYESLFTGFTPAGVNTAKSQFLLRQGKSVLDLVAEDAQRLAARYSNADKRTMEQFYASVRAVEKNLESVTPTEAICKVPTAPATSWPVDTQLSYSQEDLRADVLTDLIAMAFACDQSRVSSLLLTTWKCWMNALPVVNVPTDIHELTHGGGGAANSGGVGLADALAWLVKQLGRLVVKLKAMPEIDGSTILDHSALVLLFEGGNGRTKIILDAGQTVVNPAHSTEDMAVLVAGGAGGIKRGIHVRAPGMHPAQVVISAMKAVGVNSNLGDLSGTIPGLF